jgi:ABC-type branched-subunit amino acid transport system ATPase component
MHGSSPLLTTSSLTVTYGGVRAVDDVSLEVPAGALIGLIGPNGAGKTSLVDALTGLVPYAGHVTLGGAPLDRLAPHARYRRGLVRTFQAIELFDDLDVLGNLIVAASRPVWWAPLADLVRPAHIRDLPAVERAVRLLGIEHLLERFPAELSDGERKLVGLCRGLAGSPRVLVLDEPAAGLDTTESRPLGELLRAIVATGVTVLLIDHDMSLVMTVCDLVHVIEFGALIATGTPAQITHDDRVVAAYLGSAKHGEPVPQALGLVR